MGVKRERKTAEMIAEEMENEARDLVHTAALLRGHITADMRIFPRKSRDSYPFLSKEKQYKQD